MSDTHIGIIDHHHKIISGRTIGPLQNEIVQFGNVKHHLAAQQVFNHHRTLERCLEPDHRGSPFRRVGPLPAGSIIFGFESLFLRLTAFLIQFFRRTVTTVGFAFLKKLVDLLRIKFLPLCLPVRAFVPVQPQPPHGLQNFGNRILRGALMVGVLNA